MASTPVGLDVSKPIRQSLLACVCRKKLWKCLIISFLLYGCFAASLICWARGSSPGYSTGCARHHSFIPLSLFLMLYVLYIIECWRNAPALLPLVSRTFILQYIHLIRHAAPVIWWRVVCYHFVRRSRQIVRYRNGEPSTVTQVYYERTDSHVDEQEFDYANCGVRDVSHEVADLEKYSLVKINFSKCFSFSNLACENQYLGQRCEFFRSNEGWDNYLEAKEGMKLRNVEWQDHVIVCKDPTAPPIYISHQFYWICSVLLGSWFLRVFLEYRTALINYQVEKLFGICGDNATLDHISTPLGRVATMDSTEMEWQIQTNQLFIPSYEEATTDARQLAEILPTQTITLGDIAGSRSRHVKYSTAMTGQEFRMAPIHRTRSWIRDGGRVFVTSLRSSVSQLFGRPLSGTAEDDDVNLIESPRRPQSRINPGRPLAEAPPSYSEAVELHRILGFYDERNRESTDVNENERSERSLNRTSGESGQGAPAACNHRSGTRKKIQRRRPDQLRIRSQYSEAPTPTLNSFYSSRGVITGPAALSATVDQRQRLVGFPPINKTIDRSEDGPGDRDLGPASALENSPPDSNREQTRSCGDVNLSKNSPAQEDAQTDAITSVLVKSSVNSYGATDIGDCDQQ